MGFYRHFYFWTKCNPCAFYFFYICNVKLITTAFLSFIFLVQPLVPGMDWCGDLLSIPNLVEHYNEQAEDTGISFLSFMDHHYGDKGIFQSHHKDEHDGKLPFQGSHCHSCCHTIVYIDTSYFKIDSFKILKGQTQPIFYQPSFSSASLGSVFHPPIV